MAKDKVAQEWEARLKADGLAPIEPLRLERIEPRKGESFDEALTGRASPGALPAKWAGKELREAVLYEAKRELGKLLELPIDESKEVNVATFVEMVHSVELEHDQTARDRQAWDLQKRLIDAFAEAFRFCENVQQDEQSFEVQSLAELVSSMAKNRRLLLSLVEPSAAMLDRPKKLGSRQLVVDRFASSRGFFGREPTDKTMAFISLLWGNWPDTIDPSEPMEIDSVIEIEQKLIEATRRRMGIRRDKSR